MLKRLTVEEAGALILAGELVVFPTETSYGLACRAFDGPAVARLVRAKARPDGKPLPILLPGLTYLRRNTYESPMIALAEAFWPGALTLVVPAFPGLPGPVTAGTNMVGVRMSAHPHAQALLEIVGEPIVATSANQSGYPASRSSAECDDSGLVGVAGLIDGGVVAGGGSTVVGMVDGDLKIHREGPVAEAELRAIWEASRA